MTRCRLVTPFLVAVLAATPALAQPAPGDVSGSLPEWLMRPHVVGIQAWPWVLLLMLAVAAHVVSGVVAWTTARVARALARRTATEADDLVLDAVHPPLRYVLTLLMVVGAASALELAPNVRAILARVVSLAWIALVAWALVRLVDAMLRGITRTMAERGHAEAIATLAVARRAVKAVVVLLAVLAGLQTQGVNVTGLLAGLGLAGLAVSLAAQKTLENVFGGIVLSTDQPVRVGDLCRFGDKTGVVEDIGLRSTRVRTPDRTVVSVPNAELSTSQIENFSVRDRIRFHATLGLSHETSAAQLRDVLAALGQVLRSHALVEQDSARVRLIGIGASSFDVELQALLRTTVPDEFSATREQILLSVMDRLASAGVALAAAPWPRRPTA